ncbi:MAG: alkaline phosphatase family protein, partial [Novosphingobium sp.]
LADEAAPPPPKPPALVVAISVDQFSADLFAQYRRHFTGGLARLQQGAVFPSGFQSHAATETCPGHSTLLTGARPARTGIVANNWFDPSLARADKRVYCAEDESNPASTSRDPVVSAAHLMVPTLGEWLKRANPASRNVAVSAKDRAVMMMGGKQIDAAYWWKGSGFVSYAGQPLAPAAQSPNLAAAALIKKGARAFKPPAWCAARDRAIAAGRLTVGQGRFALEAGKGDSFRVSPRMDAATVDLAIRLFDSMRLGKGGAPDVLSVSLSATDYVGHAYGTEGMEMCIQLAELDRSLGRLLAHLDASHVDYVAVLSADHGGFDLPERLAQQANSEAMRVDPALSPGALAKTVSARTGVTVPAGALLYGDGAAGDIHINPAISGEQKALIISALTNILKSHPQVDTVITSAQLLETPMPSGTPDEWTILQRARASFYPGRSGDVQVMLKHGVVPIPDPNAGYVATHGSVWNYDRRVPILFWRKGLAGMEQPAPVETVDIAPTLAAIMGLAVPQGAFDGRCLDIDGGAGDTCRAGQ